MTWLILTAAFLIGALGWTLGEYVLHRFLMHVPRGKGLASKEHLTHHARKNYFVTTRQKVLTASAVTAVLWPIVFVIFGAAIATVFVVGFISMYVLYEFLHRRAHTHAPANAYGRWLRMNHFAHHFTDPNANFGVTSPVWDIVFRTHDPVESVRVPRRWTMDWLVDTTGSVMPEFADDYYLAGRVAAVSDDDTEAAFANSAPAA